jgi:methenyltetrahydromethanopterin cyclohydrolase
MVVIGSVNYLLTSDGCAFFTVRRNVKNVGFTSIGTYQENTVLPFEVVFENSDYCIYKMDNSLG